MFANLNNKSQYIIMASEPTTANQNEIVLKAENVNVYYGNFLAVKGIYFDVPKNKVTAFIGPSGCGKSTLLRCYNRLNDLIPIFRLEGLITYHDQNLYGKDIDPVQVRRRIGIVFQRPNPFPKSIYDNIAFGARINGYKGDMDELVERSLDRQQFGMKLKINSNRVVWLSVADNNRDCVLPEQLLYNPM